MSTNFPGGLDTFVNPVGTDDQDAPDHAAQHTNINDAVLALETRVGITGSVVTNTLTYQVNQLNAGKVNGNTVTAGTGTLTLSTFTLTVGGNSSINGTFSGTSSGTNTGDVANTALTTGTLAQFAATTSAQLAGVISDETGSGALVFATNAALVTPILGTPQSGNLVNCTGYPGIPAAANPSASVGLTAVNGTATTFLRSDSSPPLDQTQAYVLSALGLTTTTVGLRTPKIYPAADSTTAIKILKADGTTAIVTVDSTNSFLGVGITPTSQLHVSGTGGQAVGSEQVKLVSTSGLFAVGYFAPAGAFSVQRFFENNTRKMEWGWDASTPLGYIYVNANNGLKFGTNDTERMRISATGVVTLGASQDAGFARNAAGVIEVNTGTAGVYGWLVDAGIGRASADATNATTTLSTAITLAGNLISGRKYIGRAVLRVSNSQAAEGIKAAFAGTSTFSSFWAIASIIGGGTAVAGTLISTSQTGVMNYTTITGDSYLAIDFEGVCNGSGTLLLQTAEDSHTSGTLTTSLGSFMWAKDTIA